MAFAPSPKSCAARAAAERSDLPDGLSIHPEYAAARRWARAARPGRLDAALAELTTVLKAAPEHLAALKGVARSTPARELRRCAAIAAHAAVGADREPRGEGGDAVRAGVGAVPRTRCGRPCPPSDRPPLEARHLRARHFMDQAGVARLVVTAPPTSPGSPGSTARGVCPRRARPRVLVTDRRYADVADAGGRGWTWSWWSRPTTRRCRLIARNLAGRHRSRAPDRAASAVADGGPGCRRVAGRRDPPDAGRHRGRTAGERRVGNQPAAGGGASHFGGGPRRSGRYCARAARTRRRAGPGGWFAPNWVHPSGI